MRGPVLVFPYGPCLPRHASVADEGQAALPRDQRTDQPPLGTAALLGHGSQPDRLLTGWANYFCLGPVRCAYAAAEEHARRRLRQWLCGKHQVRGRGISRFPDAYLHDQLGLVRLVDLSRTFPWAKP
jgi:hypothetical protein